MDGELVQAAQIIAGTGAAGWLADKLLGPSAQALGEQFKAYAGERLRKIFQRASEKVELDAVQALPPGFAMNFLQKASYSDDDENLTDMWANLLANAALSFENRHSAYVEILSQMTASDARVLDWIIPESKARELGRMRTINDKMELKLGLAKGINNVSENYEAAHNEIERILRLDLQWPVRVNAARVYYQQDGKNLPLVGGREDQTSQQDNLVRLGLLERFEISNSLTHLDVGFEGVMASTLGVGFIQACGEINDQ